QADDAFISATCAVNQSSPNQHQYRPSRGGSANNDLTPNANTAASFPNNWLRLTRTNSVITMYASAENVTWTVLASVDTAVSAHGFGTPWPSLVTVGIAVTAHDNNNNSANFTTATFARPVLNSTGGIWTAPTAVNITRDVASVSTYV